MSETNLSKRRRRFDAPRTILLIEIERYCGQPNCLHLNRIGLTKEEAEFYTGFECEKCERRNVDAVSERDIPEWWTEITLNNNKQ